MSPIGWNVLLLGWKWLLILLVYAMLILVLYSVRREMAGQRPKADPTGAQRAQQTRRRPAAGHLQVIQPGSVARLYPGTLLSLGADNHLGAAADNDIVLQGAFISAHHARLRWDGAAWWVEDLASRNGTSVAGRVCLPYAPQALPPGVPLQVGDATFELVESK